MFSKDAKSFYLIQLFILLLAHSLNAEAQVNTTWGKTLPNSLSINGMCTDMTGNLYLTGNFQDSFVIGSDTFKSNGYFDIFLMKLDPAGHILWVFTLGEQEFDYSNAVATDSEGNVYICGSYLFTLDFDPSNNTHSLTSNGGRDIFLAKYSPEGHFIWAQTYGSSETNPYLTEEALSMAITVTDEIYLSGKLINKGVDIFLYRISSSGALIYGFNTGASQEDFSKSIAADRVRNIYLTGRFYGNVDFDPGSGTKTLYSTSTDNIFFAKYNASLQIQWVYEIDGSGSRDVKKIATSPEGDVFMCGTFQGTLYYDPTNWFTTIKSTRPVDYLIKLGPTGEAFWAGMMNARIEDICADNFSNIIVSGTFNDTCDFDITSKSMIKYPSAESDLFIAKYNKDGELIWLFTFGGTGFDQGNHIYFDRNGVFYLQGLYENEISFNTGNGSVSLSDTSIMPPFIVRFVECQPTTISLNQQKLVSCHLGSDGIIKATVSGGLGGFSYSIDSGKTFQYDPVFSNLSAKRYQLISKDTAGCLVSDTITLKQIPKLELSETHQDEYDSADGWINIYAKGGTAPYRYLWNTGDTIKYIVNLRSGIYKVIVRDKNTCADSLSIELKGKVESNQDLEIQEFKTFPNPAKSCLTVESLKPFTLSLSDISGKIIMNKHNLPLGKNVLDFRNLNSGVYFLYLTCESQIQVIKLLVASD